MLAGKTKLEVNTHVIITRVASNDPDEAKLVGVTGRITHPFPGLMNGNPSKYLAGLWVDDIHIPEHGRHVNLMLGDDCESLTSPNAVSPNDKAILEKLAAKIADDTSRAINHAISTIQTPTMPYKAQYVLEALIEILQARV